MNRQLLEEVAWLAAGTALAVAIIVGVESGRILVEVALGVVVGAPLLILVHESVHAAAAVWLTGKHVFVQMGPDPALVRFSIGRVDFRLGGTHPATFRFGTPDAPPRRLGFVLLAGAFGSIATGALLCGVAFGMADHGSLLFRALLGAGALSLVTGVSNLVPAPLPRWWPGTEARGETDARAGMRLIAAHREAVRRGVRASRVGPEHLPGAGREALQRAEARFEAGSVAGARRALEQAVASPEPDAAAAAQFDLGLLARKDGNNSEAVERYEAALQAGVPGPSSAAAINLAALLERAGRHAAACHALERAIALGHPRWAPFAQANLGDVLARAGDWERAADAYRASLSAPQHDHTARAAYRLGKLLIANGDERAGRAALSIAAGVPEGKYADAAREALSSELQALGLRR